MVTDDKALDQFVSGLKPATATHITEKNPCDYDEAVQMALAYESGRCLGYRSTMQTSTLEYLQHNGVAPIDVSAVVAAMLAQLDIRTNGNYHAPSGPASCSIQCYWCQRMEHTQRNCRDQAWAHKELDMQHRRSTVKPQCPAGHLNAMEFSDNDSCEINNEHVQNYTNVPKLQPISPDSKFFQAMNAMSVQSLLLYEITICDQRFKALIDSSASTNYVNPQVATYVTSITRSQPGQCVETAN
ncbi:hypothetical protein DFQ30_003043, partial [Apophysomyces sp. BC1015]